jgi:hypothetical protein
VRVVVHDYAIHPSRKGKEAQAYITAFGFGISNASRVGHTLASLETIATNSRELGSKDEDLVQLNKNRRCHEAAHVHVRPYSCSRYNRYTHTLLVFLVVHGFFVVDKIVQ